MRSTHCCAFDNPWCGLSDCTFIRREVRDNMRKMLLGVAIMMCLSQVALAQSAQTFSIQGSLLHENGWGEAFNWPGVEDMPGGFGAEVQFRYNPGKAISWGGGIQTTRHTWNDLSDNEWTLDMIGLFLEPRYVLPFGGSGFAPYLAARLALTRQSVEVPGISGSATGQTINGGGGVLVRLAPRVNLDLGATYGYTRFGRFSFEGTSTAFPNGNGTNLITRVGLAIGLGK
jgi:opacity protein-like surface antigen